MHKCVLFEQRRPDTPDCGANGREKGNLKQLYRLFLIFLKKRDGRNKCSQT